MASEGTTALYYQSIEVTLVPVASLSGKRSSNDIRHNRASGPN